MGTFGSLHVVQRSHRRQISTIFKKASPNPRFLRLPDDKKNVVESVLLSMVNRESPL